MFQKKIHLDLPVQGAKWNTLQKKQQFAPEKWCLEKNPASCWLFPFHGDILIFFWGGRSKITFRLPGKKTKTHYRAVFHGVRSIIPAQQQNVFLSHIGTLPSQKRQISKWFFEPRHPSEVWYGLAGLAWGRLQWCREGHCGEWSHETRQDVQQNHLSFASPVVLINLIFYDSTPRD